MRQVKNFLEPLAQPWVRNIENSIEGLEGVQADIAESDRSQGVILRSVVDTVAEIRTQQDSLEEQQEELETQQEALTSTVDRLDGQVVNYTQSFTQYGAQTTDTDDSVSGGPEILFQKPTWASFGILLAISRYQTSSTVPTGYVYNCDAVLRNTPIPVNFGGPNLQMTGGMEIMWSSQNNSFTPVLSMSPIMVEVGGSAGIYLRIATSMRNTYNSAATFRYTILWH